MKTLVRFGVMLSLLLLYVAILRAQVRQAEFEIHKRGQLWETMKDDGTIGAPEPSNQFEFFPSMDWPGGQSILPSKTEQRSYMVGAGLWIGGNMNGSVFFTGNGPLGTVDAGTFEPIEKVENFIGSVGYDPDQAEETITATFTTSENIRVRRTSMTWSFRGLNSFIIIEYVFSNLNSTALADVYFGFPYLIRPSYQDFIVHNGWGDDFNRTDELVKYDETRALLFAYDDTPNFSLPNDVGNYWNNVDEMRTPGYAGFALLFADAATDNSLQPANAFWAQLLNNERYFALTSTSREAFYDILSGQDRSLQAAPGELLTPVMFVACGPYNLNSGDEVKIVIAEAVNGIPIEESVDGLAAQALLPAGEDSLKNTIDRAKELYSNNYRLSTVPPPSPSVEIIPVPATPSITVSWEAIEQTWVNPIDADKEIAEYRLYRSDRSFNGPYKQIRKVRLKGDSRLVNADRRRFFDKETGRWRDDDQSITVGTNYYYSVTAVDEDGNESWLTNRNEEAVKASNKPAENTMNVRVFPNPFRQVSGFPTTGQEDSIVWTNLPSQCTVRVYTTNGELVKSMVHDDDVSGEEVWNQTSDSRQRTASGIYFWTVDSEVGQAKGTLLIIK